MWMKDKIAGFGDSFGPGDMDWGGEGPWVIKFVGSEEVSLALEAEGFVEVHSKTRNWGTEKMMVKSLGVDEGSYPDAA